MGVYNLVSRSVGSFKLDVTTAEVHESTLTITENPVESGANIADHAILSPRALTITGTMVDYEPKKAVQSALSAVGINTDDYPLPFELSGVTTQAVSMLNRYVAVVDTAADNASRMLAPFLPDELTFNNDQSESLDRVGKAKNQLLALQRSGELIEIVSGLGKYKNMLITSVSVSQQYDGSAEFTITTREVFIVESKTASGLKVKTARAGKQSAKKKSLGKTSPKEDKSALKRLEGIF